MSRAITDENVRLWRKEYEQLVEEQHRIQARTLELHRMLQAAEILGLGVGDPDSDPQVPAQGVDDPTAHTSPAVERSTLPVGICAVLETENRLLRPQEIKQAVLKAGVPAEKFGQKDSYFYVVLKRLVDQGKIKRQGKRYRIAK